MTHDETIAEAEYGVLEVEDGVAVVRFVRRLAHPPEKVWRALTEDEHLAAWFPTTIEGDRAVGAALTFRHREMDLEPMTGELLAFDRPSLLELTWGGDRLRFELSPDGEGTRLALTATMGELGKAARDGAGWHLCLDNLARELSGEQVPDPSRGDEWRELNGDYVARFGPEASTIGPPKEWQDLHGEASSP
jgi:uncharacterized protein YndB with AHSA1/START domain